MNKDIFYNGLTEQRSISMILLGILCLVCGCIGLTASYVALIFFAGGFGMLSYHKGVIIDAEANTITYYYSIFGFKERTREPLRQGYKNILFREHDEVNLIHNRRWNTGQSRKTVFIVLLVNETTRFNKLLYKSESEESARKKGIELSEILGLPFKELERA